MSDTSPSRLRRTPSPDATPADAPITAVCFADTDPEPATFDFYPVPTKRRRRDGWTPARQAEFIGALMRIGTVTTAARHVGMSAKSAYALLKRARMADYEAWEAVCPRDAAGHPLGGPMPPKPDDEPLSFAEAWEWALELSHDRVRSDAIDRAINGTVVPIFYGGRQIGERREYHDKLLLAALLPDDSRVYPPPPRRRRARTSETYALSPEELEYERAERAENERRLTEQGYYAKPARHDR